MIRKIEIGSFKSIVLSSLPTRALNIFTGTNGSGKSSYLQSLLLLRQSHSAGSFIRKGKAINLGNNESLTYLGTYKDVLCQSAKKGEEKIKIDVLFDKGHISFVSQEYTPDNKGVNQIPGSLEFSALDIFESNSLFNENFQYLASDRISPHEDYPRFQGDESLGRDGRFTAHYLEKYPNKDISIKELSFYEHPKSYCLLDQVNDWMGIVSKNIEVSTKENLNTNRIELSFRYRLADGTPLQDNKPQNVGFGITHTLPIIVAILAAKAGDILIIENPETHLHPNGQSNLARLFCRAAEHGIQLFIETHSDHIINGIRIAVKNQLIDHSNVSISYFTKDSSNNSVIQSIEIDKLGGLDVWPDGFFDEWDNSLSELL